MVFKKIGTVTLLLGMLTLFIPGTGFTQDQEAEAGLEEEGEPEDKLPEESEEDLKTPEQLQARLKALEEEIAKLKQAGLAPTSEERLFGETWGPDWFWRVLHETKIGGYASVKYVKSENALGFFNLPRFVLFLYSPVGNRITFSTELEVENGGVHAQDPFRFQGEVALEFAVADFRIQDWLNLRGGMLLIPFGKFNLVHDEPIRDFTERPLYATFITPTTWFEPGFGLFGETYPGGEWKINYELYLTQGFTDRITEGGGLRSSRSGLSFDTNENKALVGRVAVEPLLNLELGISGYAGKYDPEDIRTIAMLGGDATVKIGPFEYLIEYAEVFLEKGLNNEGEIVPEGMRGFYTQLNYHFFPGFLKRRMPEDLQDSTFTLVGRYDQIDTNTAVSDENDRQGIGIGLNYRPVEDFVIKTEYHFFFEDFSEKIENDKFAFSMAVAF